MLAKAENVEPDLIGKLDLLDQIAQSSCRVDLLAGDRVGADIAECEEPEFHCSLPSVEGPASCRSGGRPLRVSGPDIVAAAGRRHCAPVNSPSTLSSP